MLSSAAVALVLVGRALTLRKHDLAMCFALERAHASMSDLAERDPLTGARNRRFLERDFARITALHAADATSAYFGLLDIDHFKQINDASGHQYGDAVLAALAQAFADLDGTREYLVRLGGDEFAFVLCGADPLARLERMLATAADLALASSLASVPASRPTMSAGLLLLAPDRAWTLDGAYAGADALLYQAKRAGRARICHEGAAS
jgi:diguanylate cyclase (GGDEF)-like protein